MVIRWVAAAAIEAARGFRRVRGFKSIPTLAAALRAHERSLQTHDDAVAQELMTA